MTSILHFFCGKAGAGKSTIAKDLARSEGAILISEDIWLTRLFGDQMKTFDNYLVFSAKLKTVMGPLVINLLSSGQSVALDFPANTKPLRAWFRSLFEQAGSRHRLHFVSTSNELCLERIERRNIERLEGSHHLTKEDFAYVSSFFQAPEADESFDLEIYRAGAQA